mmetsp:Transcript_58377/g.94431  ORF Transcript_58377/g.94431 Transcript_58377/m.94431 type:complete len:240 (-) Transcript_58377:188-907(-)
MVFHSGFLMAGRLSLGHWSQAICRTSTLCPRTRSTSNFAQPRTRIAARIITVSGLPGSGTTTLCKLLQMQLAGHGWAYVNAGAVFREMAKDLGLTLQELGQRAELDPQIDRDLDLRMLELTASSKDPVILEGRMTGWVAHRAQLPSLKLWVGAPAAVRAGRVASREGISREKALEDMLSREACEARRYLSHHGVDLGDVSVYDEVLDSAREAPEVLVARVFRHPVADFAGPLHSCPSHL